MPSSAAVTAPLSFPAAASMMPAVPDAKAPTMQLDLDVSLASMVVSPPPSTDSARHVLVEAKEPPSTPALTPPAPRLHPPLPSGYARALPAAVGADVATMGASVASGRRWAPTPSDLFVSLAAAPPMTAPIVRRPAAEGELHTPLTSPLSMHHLAHAASLDAAARALGGLLGPPAAPADTLLGRRRAAPSPTAHDASFQSPSDTTPAKSAMLSPDLRARAAAGNVGARYHASFFLPVLLFSVNWS